MMDTRGRLNGVTCLEQWAPAPGFESLEAIIGVAACYI